MRNNNILKAITFTTQTRIFISFEFLINNNLKRKLKQSIKTNRILNIDAIQKNIIINYLVKKSRSNKLSIFLLKSILILIENSIINSNVSQVFNKIQIKIEEKL